MPLDNGLSVPVAAPNGTHRELLVANVSGRESSIAGEIPGVHNEISYPLRQLYLSIIRELEAAQARAPYDLLAYGVMGLDDILQPFPVTQTAPDAETRENPGYALTIYNASLEDRPWTMTSLHTTIDSAAGESPEHTVVIPNSRRLALPGSISSTQTPGFPISPNYGGDLTYERNIPANITEDQSVSIWIANLPSNCTYRMVLGSIRGAGKVWSSHISPPSEKNPFPAAKVQFWSVQGINAFMQQYHAGSFVVGDKWPVVKRNRVRAAAPDPSNATRVIRIRGDSTIVRKEILDELFAISIRWWHVDEVVTLQDDKETNKVELEYRFGSYRCQASVAWPKTSTPMGPGPGPMGPGPVFPLLDASHKDNNNPTGRDRTIRGEASPPPSTTVNDHDCGYVVLS
ncbi:hypothetical protein F4778DRAFT_715120 [Xylariomycetidae sp. FL2044]|nr:hypothetical protein F4778DRAFT_715120 [Xylariomycetidae sp. FL2044]